MEKVYISKEANKSLVDYLNKEGFKVVFLEPIKNLPHAISMHPDLRMCQLDHFDNEVFHGNSNLLGSEYPMDIRYNGASTGKYFIHNLKYTDDKLLEKVKDLGLTTINVSQGYGKCSIVIVDESSIITYDKGIAKICKEKGLHVLLVESGHVALPGYNTGFIGGASGTTRDRIIFHGDLSKHPNFDEIKKFVEERGKSLVFFDDFPLIDIGSIIFEGRSCDF